MSTQSNSLVPQGLSRRDVLLAVGGTAAVAIGSSNAFAQKDKTREAEGDTAGTRCLVTLQLDGLEPDTFSDEKKAKSFLDKFTPIIAQELVRAKSQPRTRGCSASATVTSSGSVSGTVTCTF